MTYCIPSPRPLTQHPSSAKGGVVEPGEVDSGGADAMDVEDAGAQASTSSGVPPVSEGCEGQPASSRGAVEAFAPAASAVLVKLPYSSDECDMPLTLRFQFLPALGVVTAQSDGGPNNGTSARRDLLANLYEDDTGERLPCVQLSPFLAAAPLDKGGLHPTLHGRPYKWAQYLGGLSMLHPVAPIDGVGIADTPVPQSPEAPTVDLVQRLQLRMQAQDVLSSQLVVLSKCPHPVPVDASVRGANRWVSKVQLTTPYSRSASSS